MTTQLEELQILLKKTPSHPNWRKVCELIDRWPQATLSEAISAIDAQAARWDVDTNKSGGWEMPARYTPQSWAKRLLAGDVPQGFSVARLFQQHSAKLLDTGLERLLKTGALGAITHLYLGSCSLGAGALALLADHQSQLGALTHLILTNNSLAPDGLAALLATPLARRLVMLDISQTSLDARSFKALLATPLPALRYLDLSYIEVSSKEIAAIVETDTLPQLTTLRVPTTDAQKPNEALRARGVGHPHLLAALREHG
jgi:hypothetical protein